MLNKGLLAIAGLAALVAIQVAPSQSNDPIGAAMAYTSKGDFDRAFANFNSGSDVGNTEALNANRELLRHEGIIRAKIGSSNESLQLLKTRITDSPVALSLFSDDETLYSRELVAPSSFVLSAPEAATINTEASESETVNNPPSKLAAASPTFDPAFSSSTSSFYCE
jgi:hypothetical protein